METRLRAVPHQFEVMIKFMERHNDLTKQGLGVEGRLRSDRLWRQLTIILNSVDGGVKKTTGKWKKVWADWKAKTKKKNITLRRKTAPDGRIRNKITSLEERVLSLMGKSQPTPAAAMDQSYNDWQAITMDSAASSSADSSPEDVSCLPDTQGAEHPLVLTVTDEAQPSSSQMVEEEAARNTPTPPRSRSETAIPRSRMARARRKPNVGGAQTPFERAASKFVVVEERRLQLEEAKDQRMHERERMLHEREKMLHEREMERLQVESRRLDVEQTRNGLLQRLGDIPQLLTELLLRFRESSENK